MNEHVSRRLGGAPGMGYLICGIRTVVSSDKHLGWRSRVGPLS
jgi:hypothetical protein